MELVVQRLNVLVVEDNDGDARLLQEALREAAPTPVTMSRTTSLKAARDYLAVQTPDAILLDLHLPDSQGLDTLRRLAQETPRTPIIVLTGLNDESVAAQALREGAQDYLLKGELETRLLLRAIRYAMERKENAVVLRDVQEQLLQAQRMEAVGRLAGGIAHDFNNLLTVIQGYARLLLDTLPAHNATRHDISAIAQAADRAARLTQQLLAYSRKQVLQMRVLDLDVVVKGMAQLLQRTLTETITLSVSAAPDLGQVEADASQIEQVVVNLAVNARDAMPAGGRLMIACENIVIDSAWVKRHPEVQPGAYVQLAVTDTGVGMPPTVAQHVFDPFFTTKPFGQGTGLGLSTVYGIVKQHRGHIWVYSEPGHGTTFKIALPRADRPARSSDAGAPAPAAPARGTETLLLVEDETDILNMLLTYLKGLGYRVLAAPTAQQAMQLMDTHHKVIALIVCDVVLPDLSGPELYEGLRAINPDLRILFMSAYPGDAILQRGLIAADTPFIGKPFTPEALSRRIRDVLDAQQPVVPAG
ncbi:MAG: response regulator [Lentisphaerae bacterium]|nr:response regulator [Lentisphaerota bacterium]